MNTIIVATDFSDQAATALDQAIAIARRTGAEIYLVNALEEGMRDHYQEVQILLSEQQSLCTRADVRASKRIVIGYPDTGLVGFAEEVDADLIVLGTHGRTGFQRFLMGSVAERVVRMSGTNVMVARPRSHGLDGYNHILVPTDFSDAAEQALAAATQLVAKGGVIELFHCWQLPGAVTGYWGPAADQSAVLDPLRRELRETAEAQGTKLIDRYGRGAKVIATEIEDAPSHGIRKRLESDSYDLVVMGSHGRRGFRRWMLGSVAETTVRYAPCSVVVVHAQRAAQQAEAEAE